MPHMLGSLPIPSGMIWVDEFDWVPVEKSTERTITGALVIDTAAAIAGRPITLQAVDSQGWINRADLQLLQHLASNPAAQHMLRLADGREFAVTFADGEPLTATPIARPELPGPDHPYVATLRLITV